MWLKWVYKGKISVEIANMAIKSGGKVAKIHSKRQNHQIRQISGEMGLKIDKMGSVRQKLVESDKNRLANMGRKRG